VIRSPAPFRAWAGDRNVLTACVGQVCVSLCSNFVALLTPFYVGAAGVIDGRPLSPTAVVVWSGLIIAASGVTEIAGSFLWAWLTSRLSVRFLYARGVVCHVLLMAAFALTCDVRGLLAIRLLQGFLGGVSTIGLVIVSCSDRERRAANVGLFQASLTLGQVTGPFVASIVAGMVGFRGAFFAAAGLLALLAGASPFALSDMSGLRERRRLERPGTAAKSSAPALLVGALLLVFAAGCQITFLPPLLPRVLEGLGVPASEGPFAAGTIVAVYGIAAAAGGVVFGRLARRVDTGRLLGATVLVASACALLLGRMDTVASFTACRCLQTFTVSSVFPVVAEAAAGGSGGAVVLGAVNAARLLSTSVGPLAAGVIYGAFGETTIYEVVAASSLVALGAYLVSRRSAGASSIVKGGTS